MDKDKYFSDYEAFTENDILEITARGISLKNEMYIDFAECTEVWAKENSLKESKCVGQRDSTDYSFTFYTLPKPIVIKFISKGKLVEFFTKRAAYRRFRELQKKIIEFGYRTYDMS